MRLKMGMSRWIRIRKWVEVAKSPLPTLLGTSFKRVEGNARETTWGLNGAG